MDDDPVRYEDDLIRWVASVSVQLAEVEAMVTRFRMELTDAVVAARVDGLELEFPALQVKASDEEKG